MKLLLISPRFSGGIGGHAAMLADQLIKYGIEVEKLEVPHIPIKNLKKHNKYTIHNDKNQLKFYNKYNKHLQY